ncbi:GntR family transcriptional regulator, partial [Actinomyces sp. MRS3W]|uniref:GntR family transcriptional regulator n=1 Tax=Actinomyces sp. MRS3W TaxID=2800796 RepID=UPI0028FDBB03
MLTIDPSSSVPPFEQVRAQLTEQIASGALPPGTRLPAVRRLAADLQIAPGTVARAYRELERAGAVRTNRRTGTTIAPAPASARSVEDGLANGAMHAATKETNGTVKPPTAVGAMPDTAGSAGASVEWAEIDLDALALR